VLANKLWVLANKVMGVGQQGYGCWPTSCVDWPYLLAEALTPLHTSSSTANKYCQHNNCCEYMATLHSTRLWVQ
jgi:hypothetical protein